MGMAIDSMGAERGELPSLELSRHFATGGYESLTLQCRPDRTREENFACDLKRLRNGMEVAAVVVDYQWSREQLGKFFRRVASLNGARDTDPSHVLLSYDAQNDGKRLQGRLRRGTDSADPEHAKAVLALEGSLVGQFYK